MVKLTLETAVRILSSFKLVNEVDTPYKGIEVSNVSYTRKDGTPFTWDDGTPYAVVNFKAQNAHGKAKAIAHLQAGEFQEACNTNLSMRMDVEQAEALTIKTPGILVLGLATWTDAEGNAQSANLPKSYTPMVAKASVSQADAYAQFLKKQDVGAEA